MARLPKKHLGIGHKGKVLLYISIHKATRFVTRQCDQVCVGSGMYQPWIYFKGLGCTRKEFHLLVLSKPFLWIEVSGGDKEVRERIGCVVICLNSAMHDLHG